MAEQHRAVSWLHTYGRRYPRAWELYARLLDDPPCTWAPWCWCPIAGAFAVISEGRERITSEEAADLGPLAALAAWRATQGIYRFHPALLAELLDTPIAGDLPTEVLTRMPAWCVYVETAGALIWGLPLRGFFAFLEDDVNTGRRELRLVLDYEGSDAMERPGQLVVHLGGTFAEGIAAAVREARIQALRDGRGAEAPALGPGGADEAARAFGGLLSLLVYLCADEAEVTPRVVLPPKVVKGKKRPILPVAKAPVIHETGARLGARLIFARARYAREDEADAATGMSVRPHVRRAHWHHYWTGPRDAERRLVLRWLSPILVGLDDDAPSEATVRPVGEEG